MGCLVWLAIATALLAAAWVVNCNSEGDMLYKLKASVEDPNNALQSWDGMPNPCTWLKVLCNSENRVTRVDLHNDGLVGLLPPQLGGLISLEYLIVSGNHFRGNIPSELGKLGNLVGLDLSKNNLSGPIPPSFGNLTSLQFLRVSENNLNGSIPASLGNMKSLQVMDLSSNKLTGDIPVEILLLSRSGGLFLNVSNNLLATSVTGNSTERRRPHFLLDPSPPTTVRSECVYLLGLLTNLII